MMNNPMMAQMAQQMGSDPNAMANIASMMGGSDSSDSSNDERKNP